MSSEWPVCPISETTSPQRMGAALTYARRYALFTLVGIAGEDDLDAPDLLPTTSKKTELGQPITASDRDEQKPYLKRPHEKGLASTSTTLLNADASAVLRNKMIAELEAITKQDQAVGWAHGGLLAKNKLVLADADEVEQAFRIKMQSVGRNDNEPNDSLENGDLKNSEASSTSGQRTSSQGDMPTAMPVAMPSRKRDKLHRAFVCSCPCVICGRSPSDAHHIRFAQPRALGHKVSDEFTIPLCRMRSS